MSINRAQTVFAENLSFEAALDTVFDKILEQLRQIDLFSSSNQPVIFPVYAHDNPVAGTSHAWCVIQIIKWLEASGCRTISDRNPILPYHAQRGDGAATRNILSNQFCLLPRDLDQRQAANKRTHANKALVFCSEVLRNYCIDASAREYVERIEDAYKQCRSKPRDHLEHQLQITVEEKANNGGAWFHHVLTEVAFLKLRKDIDCRDHGTVSIALDGKLPQYLPFFGPTDLVIKRESASLYAYDLHTTFFKIISQIYPEQYSTIDKFKDCYMTFKRRLSGGGEAVGRNYFDAEVMKYIRKVYESILQRDHIATRHRLKDDYIDQAVEQTRGRQTSDISAVERSRKRKILRTLATVPYRDRKNRNPERDEGTCVWFRGHPKFQEWEQNRGASLLWVSADPGCGKSVLAKYLVDDFLPTTGKNITCYFFFKDDFEDQRTLVGALRCLLHQVFEQNLSLLDEKLVSRLEGNSQILNSRTDLWEILTDVFRSLVTEGFVCIIDALDECSADDRSFLLKCLKKLFMDESAPPIKLLLTSRPYEHIARGLRQLQNRELIIHLKGESEQEVDKISKEIDIVIDKNVDDLGEDLDLEPVIIRLIKNELTRMENRTYLWVALMIDILKNAIQISKTAIMSLIQRLPRSVSAAYEKILRREQNDETNTKTRRLLHIILAAREPLTPGQIAVAFSMSQRAPFDEKAISRDTRFIRDLSRLLVVIRNEKTYLAHQTVREPLIQDTTDPPGDTLYGPFVQWEHSFHPQDSNLVLAASCMSYLEQSNSNDHNLRIFLKYAAIWWAEHLRESGDLNELLIIQSQNICDSSSEKFRPWFEIYWRKTFHRLVFPTKPTRLIVASLLGLKETVELILNTTIPDLDARDSCFGRTAFSWACHEGYPNIGRLLLDRASESNDDVFRRVINDMDSQGNSPLHIAVIRYKEWSRQFTVLPDPNLMGRHYGILDLLVRRGPNVILRNRDGKTPLHIAAELNEALVKRIFPLNYRERKTLSQELLLEHMKSGNTDIGMVEFLLHHGADLNSAVQKVGAPMFKAVKSGNESMVAFLLHNGMDVNIVSNESSFKGTTPLILAIESKNIPMVEFLLRHGADLNPTVQDVGATMFKSVKSGNKSKPVLQLHDGADPDPTVEDVGRGINEHRNYYKETRPIFQLNNAMEVDIVPVGRTPLQSAIESGSISMIKLLLDYGADIHARVRIDGRLPLSEAIWLRKYEVLHILLQYGADIDDHMPWSLVDPPMVAAIKCGRIDIIEELVRRGADPNPALSFLSQKKSHYEDRANALDWEKEIQKLLLTRQIKE